MDAVEFPESLAHNQQIAAELIRRILIILRGHEIRGGDAEEIAQEAFVAMIRALKNNDHWLKNECLQEGSNEAEVLKRTKSGSHVLVRFCLATARNMAIGYFRRLVRQPKPVDPSCNDVEDLKVKNPIDAIVAIEEKERFLRAWDELPPEYREVLALRYYGDLTMAEIGEILPKEEGAVRMQVHRAIRRLKELLEHKK